MDKSKQPGINFDGIILTEEKFWRDYSIPEDATIDLKFDSSSSIENNKAVVDIVTEFKLTNDEKSWLTLDLKFVGFFSIMEEKNMNIEQFVKDNSLALMFPYIREHITSITSKAGINPIILPPINIRAVIEGNV